MQTRNVHSTYPTTVLLGALYCICLLAAPAIGEEFAKTENTCWEYESTGASLEEWETDVLGLAEECPPPNSGPQAADDGPVSQAIEEWETDVLGLRQYCAAVDSVHWFSNPRNGSAGGEFRVLWAECVAAYLEMGRDDITAGPVR